MSDRPSFYQAAYRATRVAYDGTDLDDTRGGDLCDFLTAEFHAMYLAGQESKAPTDVGTWHDIGGPR